MKLILSLTIFVSILLSSCNESVQKYDLQKQLPEISIPFITLDSLYLMQTSLLVIITDETPMSIETLQKQTIYYTLTQLDIGQYNKDTINVLIKMPNRENSSANFQTSLKYYTGIAKKLNLPVYKSFLKEFFKLNWETRLHYLEKTSCLLDRTNLEFARIIDENYKDSFPNNSTWWGFDSFVIFELYFSETVNNNQGIAHQIIEKLKTSSKFIMAEDSKEFVKLMDKYAIKMKEEYSANK